MFEDRLTHAERVRLEALSQARGMPYNVSHLPQEEQMPALSEMIFKMAERIERWIGSAREGVN